MTPAVQSPLPVSSPRATILAIPSRMRRTISERCSPESTTNCQGWRFLAEGAWVAAVRMALSASSGMGVSLDVRMVLRFAIGSKLFSSLSLRLEAAEPWRPPAQCLVSRRFLRAQIPWPISFSRGWPAWLNTLSIPPPWYASRSMSQPTKLTPRPPLAGLPGYASGRMGGGGFVVKSGSWCTRMAPRRQYIMSQMDCQSERAPIGTSGWSLDRDQDRLPMARCRAPDDEGWLRTYSGSMDGIGDSVKWEGVSERGRARGLSFLRLNCRPRAIGGSFLESVLFGLKAWLLFSYASKPQVRRTELL
jgi:hypothetical protein